MEVSSRKKRVQPSAPTGLATQGYSSSNLVSEYGQAVAAKQAALLQAVPANASGLSSSTRRSFGTAGAGSKISPLSMYNDPPQEEITLDQFERAGIDRLQAEKAIESVRLKKGTLQSKVENDPAGNPVSLITAKYNLDNAAWDRLSHFVLRLAYCKTEELRRWFLTQETALFKHRFDNESEETISNFLRDNDLSYEPLSSEELNEEVPHDGVSNEEELAHLPTVYLKDLLHRVPFADSTQLVYYKVPFEDAIDLLRDRRVLLRYGFAYVSRTNLSSIIAARFRANLGLHLAQTCRATAQMRQDVRIAPLVNMLSKQYITPTYKTGKIEGAVTKEQLPALAARSMPLCMSELMKRLKQDNHLKHGGRMQLGLFLKGIGLSLNDALAFWKQSFARSTPPEKFDKEYAYNIRHNYGKEGKRTTYTPYGCVKIINNEDEHAGCPFKKWQDATMKVKMRELNFTKPQMEDILTLLKGSHYQIACQRYYQYTHGDKLADNVGSHPNVYFDASEQYYRGLETNGGATAAAAAPGAHTGAAASAGSSATAGADGTYSAFASSAPRSGAPASASAAAPTPKAAAGTGGVAAPAPAAAAAAPSEPAPMEIEAPAAAASS